ncbi:hypothetical protein jhhlp_003130 [Lomentospora prolificans]|uniref:Siderophore biosynthesis enzyme n=1 Tax=Lomentospora prolificans TaxID=41688 RepID=A0A2N3NG10_9PEZI|nr:hypothetical protein jhhlp_003130 [Lomentospora prolificans]
MAFKRLALSALLAASALAKTDISGCETTALVVTVPGRNDDTIYTTTVYYVPDTGEICEILDCGGGRAPPKTTVPGCAAYQGTETYSPKFLPTSTSEPAPEKTVSADNTGATDAQTTAAPSNSASASDGESSGAPEPSASGSANQGGDGEFLPYGSGAAVMGASLLGGLFVAGVAGAVAMV